MEWYGYIVISDILTLSWKIWQKLQKLWSGQQVISLIFEANFCWIWSRTTVVPPPPTVAPCILPHWSNKRFSQAGLIFNLLSTVLHPELHSFICIVSYFYLVQICMASWISFLTCICLRRRVKNKKSRNIVTSLHPVLICVWCHLTLVRATSARVWYVSSARTVV